MVLLKSCRPTNYKLRVLELLMELIIPSFFVSTLKSPKTMKFLYGAG